MKQLNYETHDCKTEENVHKKSAKQYKNYIKINK